MNEDVKIAIQVIMMLPALGCMLYTTNTFFVKVDLDDLGDLLWLVIKYISIIAYFSVLQGVLRL